jgi:hypothetical protein
MNCAAISLAPGFSRVSPAGDLENRFNGFLCPGKPLKRFASFGGRHTRLKPGANETCG